MLCPAQTDKLNKDKHKALSQQHMDITCKSRGHPSCVAVRAWSALWLHDHQVQLEILYVSLLKWPRKGAAPFCRFCFNWLMIPTCRYEVWQKPSIILIVPDLNIFNATITNVVSDWLNDVFPYVADCQRKNRRISFKRSSGAPGWLSH